MLYAIHDLQYQKGNLQVWDCSLGSPPLLVLFGEWCSSHSGCFAPFLHCMHNQSWYILTDLVQPHSPSYTKDCSSVITIGSSGNSSLILKQCRSLMVSSLLKWKLVMVNDSQSQNKRSKASVSIAAIMLTVYKTAAGWAYTASFCQFGTLGITFNNWSLSGSRGIGLVSYNVLFMSKKKVCISICTTRVPKYEASGAFGLFIQQSRPWVCYFWTEVVFLGKSAAKGC